MNGITGFWVPKKSKIPFYYDTDKEAIEVALNTIGTGRLLKKRKSREWKAHSRLATLDISEAFH